MARELGGATAGANHRRARVALSPLPLFEGTEFQYSSFDYLWWVLIAYFVDSPAENRKSALVARDRRGRPAWACMTKYTIAFLVAGILGGLAADAGAALFHQRLVLGRSGAGACHFSAEPDLADAPRSHFLHFLQHIHARDVGQGRANGFLRRSIPALHESVCRAAVDRRPDRLPARPALIACWPGCT